MGTIPGASDMAPDFTLPGVPDASYTLSAFRGKIVVLAFYPADNSPVCTLQMRSYSLEESVFAGLSAVVLGISPQGTASHQLFASRNKIQFPLLSDEDKAVGERYGVLGPLGFYRRSVFVIGRNGVVSYAKRTMAGLHYLSPNLLKREIEIADSK